MKGRATNKKIKVISNSLAGKPVAVLPRNDQDCIVWDEAGQRYIHAARELPIILKTAAEFTAANSILKAGEEGYETDSRKRKVGDGVTAWNDLQYDVSSESTVTAPSYLRPNWFYM